MSPDVFDLVEVGIVAKGGGASDLVAIIDGLLIAQDLVRVNGKALLANATCAHKRGLLGRDF